MCTFECHAFNFSQGRHIWQDRGENLGGANVPFFWQYENWCLQIYCNAVVLAIFFRDKLKPRPVPYGILHVTMLRPRQRESKLYAWQENQVSSENLPRNMISVWRGATVEDEKEGDGERKVKIFCKVMYSSSPSCSVVAIEGSIGKGRHGGCRACRRDIFHWIFYGKISQFPQMDRSWRRDLVWLEFMS